MAKLLLYISTLLIGLLGCQQQSAHDGTMTSPTTVNGSDGEHSGGSGYQYQGALLLTRFKSLDELKREVRIEYIGENGAEVTSVRLTHESRGTTVVSELSEGIDQSSFLKAQTGKIWDRVSLAAHSPFALFNAGNMLRIEILARWRPMMFGEGDLAFYDLAEAMVFHISDEDIRYMPTEDLSEKGYLNTFNHITAQAFITTLFSEEVADFIADVHERYAMPELITGNFSQAQLDDLETGPIDNYVDIINNEWGQELGKELKARYNISRETNWTPQLLADYLNDIQDYYSWCFGIAFKPFRPTDDEIVKYSAKINAVIDHVSELRRHYF